MMAPQDSTYELPEKSFISFDSGGLPMASLNWKFLGEKEAENG
jgi:hypothetical protein